MMNFLAFLEKLANWVIWLMCMVSILVLGWLDNITGFEMSFSLFYLIPVSMAAWGIGRQAGLFVSMVSAITWVITNWLAGETYSNDFVAVWNAWIRLGFYVVVTMLLAALKFVIYKERGFASTDSLTGILNKRAFYEQLHIRYRLNRLADKPLTLVYMDLDNFKFINDTYGYAVGDQVLTVVADVIKNSIRGKDIAGRLGGDEFGLILSEAEHAIAEK